MAKLTEIIPAWTAGYIGIPFSDRGRDRLGLDCWGLTRMVYAERFGIYLPSLADGYARSDDPAEVAELFQRESGLRSGGAPGVEERSLSNWELVQHPQFGDLVSFRIAGKHGHVGMMVADNQFLHAIAGVRSCVERLSSPTWNRRHVGFWMYRGPVHVKGRPVFLNSDSIDVSMPAGMTVAELIRAAGVEMSPYLVVHVGGTELAPELWERVRPRPGRVVTVAAVPRGDGQAGGGGKTALRVVATIAVIALAAYTGGLAGAAYGATWGAVTTAAVGIVGTLAINALIRPPAPRLSLAGGSAAADAISPTIASGRNEVRPYGVVPCAFGTYRWAPPYGAKPYTEVQGDAHYLRCVFNCGEGPLEISGLQIGDTPIEQYDGVEIETRAGYLDDPPLTLFPNAVNQEQLSIALTQGLDWVSRTTADAGQELSVDIEFPSGLVEFQSDGIKVHRAVEVAVEYRKVGDVDWKMVNGGGTASGSPTSAREMDFMFRSPENVYGDAGIHKNDLNWSADQAAYPDAKPVYLPSTEFAWKVEGWLYAPYVGTYQFMVDSNDASDVYVDDKPVANWYGGHGTEVTYATLDATSHDGPSVGLDIGWHRFRARVECRTTTNGALAVGWRTPIDGAFKIIPQDHLSPLASGFGNQGSLNYSFYFTDGYRSSIYTLEARTDPIRRTLSWAVPDSSPGVRYEVRLRRLTPDTNATTIVDKVFWSALRTITTKDPLPSPGTAKLAIRIRATDQLNGVIDTLTVLTRSIVDDFDGSTGAWIKRGTSNPASILRRILNGPPSSPILPDARLYLAEFHKFHTDCITRGLSFNGIIDFAGTLAERAQDVAAAGRGTLAMRDGLFTVVRDRPQSVPIQHLTPANSRGFTAQKTFADLPHAFRVKFMDAAIGYQQNERIVPDDDHAVGGLTAFGLPTTLPEATRIESLEVFGCTSMDEAFRHGRYNLAVAKLRPEVFSITTDIEHMVCTRGDLVLVTHDVPLWGQSWGRVTGLVTDTGGNLKAIRTDNNITMDVGGLYRVRVRLQDGSTWLKDVVTVPGVTQELTLASLVGVGQPMPAVGDLYMFGPPGYESRELIVKGIEIDRDLGAKLTLIDHAPAVHLADQGVIPPYDSGITGPPRYEERPEDPIITSIRSDDLVMIRGADGSLQNRMLITLLPPSGKHPIPIAVQARTRPKPAMGAGDSGAWTTHPTVSIDNNSFGVTEVEQSVTYQIKIRTVSSAGLTSHWVSAEHTIIGKTFPPPDVQSFDVQRLSDGTRRYSWVLGVVPPDIAGVKIRYGVPGSHWDMMDWLHDDVLQASPAELNTPTQGTWRFGIKMVDTSGNESVNAIYLDKTFGLERLEGVAFSDDAGLSLWPGIKFNCHLANATFPPALLEPDDTVTWDGLTSGGGATWDSWPRWILGPKTPIVYEHIALDAGFVFDWSPDAITAGTGAVVTELAWSSDGVTYTDWAEVSTVRQLAITARYLKARVTVNPTNDVPVPTITRLLVLMRAPTVTFELQDVVTSALPPTSIIGVGDVRLPVEPGRFTLIRHIALTFNGMGPGWTWELFDKDVVVGPRVRMYNADGVLSHATVDAVIRGL